MGDMKITGAEFKEWHETAWPEEWVWADDSVLADGRELYTDDGSLCVASDEVFTIPAEWVIIPENSTSDGKSVRSLVKKWQHGKSTMIVAVEIPREREEELKAYMASLNLKIVA